VIASFAHIRACWMWVIASERSRECGTAVQRKSMKASSCCRECIVWSIIACVGCAL